jgi:hydroxymethylbilane synthase
VTDGELDGVVLACAGLARIGHAGAITQVFELDEMLPAPGQGALAVECRDGEPELAALLEVVNDQASMAAAIAERSLLEALAVGCRAPVGGYAVVSPAGGSGPATGGQGSRGVPPGQHEQLLMHAAVLSPDGTRALRAHGSAPAADARRLGRDLAAELLRRGASDLISSPMAPTSSGNDVQ